MLMTVLQGPTWTGPFMSIHTILLTMPQPYPPKIPHLCHCLRAFALAISSAWNILFQILMWFMVEFSSFKFSAKISFRDLWPSVVNLYGANIAKLLIGSSELYLHNSRIVWIKEVFGMRLRGLRESNQIQTLDSWKLQARHALLLLTQFIAYLPVHLLGLKTKS